MLNLFPKWSKTESPWYGSNGCVIGDKHYTLVELMQEFVKLKDENEKLYKGPSYIQAQQDMIDELMKEVKDAKLMSEERDNKWRTFNNSLRAQIKGLKEENEKLKEGNSQWSKLYEDVCKDRKELEAILGSIAEDGTYEHNNAVKLREQLAEVKLVNENLSKAVDEHKAEKEKLELKLVAYHKMTEGASESINELNKEVNSLRHLKEENVNLIDKIRQLEVANERWQSRFNTFENMEKQIINNDYTLCARQRDEYKHQLNAANKELEILNVEQEAILKANKNLKEVIDKQKIEIIKLQNDVVDYVFEKDNSQCYKALNTVTEKYYVCNHCGYKLAHDTNYYGGCGFCKEGLMIEKEEVVQKHPMYPIHWGTLDPNIHEKAKNISIEETIKDIAKSEAENEDPLEVIYKLLQKAKDLTKGVEVDLDKSLDEQCEWDNLPKSFPNEFQDETTAENLEEKFDRREDVIDYFTPYHCPCNMCKHAREENTEKSWERAASDLDSRVIKLEKKIEELTIGNIYGSKYKI